MLAYIVDMRNILLLSIVFLVSGCSLSDLGTKPGEERVVGSQSAKLDRRDSRGKLTGEDGITLFGGESGGEESSSSKSGIAVNSYLWRATLDTLSFMPISSADPFGGVILTDWYEAPEAKGERFKVNVIILTKTLRSDGVKLSVFKQKLEGSSWRDQPTDNNLAHKLEDAILARARELKIGTSK
jgi:Domain of unknown function (DUF3576)